MQIISPKDSSYLNINGQELMFNRGRQSETSSVKSTGITFGNRKIGYKDLCFVLRAEKEGLKIDLQQKTPMNGTSKTKWKLRKIGGSNGQWSKQPKCLRALKERWPNQ